MQKYLSTFLLLLIPAIASLAHDITRFFWIADTPDFQLSDYGYLLVTYAPNQYVEMQQAVTPYYKPLVELLLDQQAVIFGVGYAIFGFLFLFIQYYFLRLLFGRIGGSGYARAEYSQSPGSLRKRDNVVRMKYKRN